MDILILSTSPRASSIGNSKALAEAFARGISSAGGTPQVITLHTDASRETAVNAYWKAQFVVFVVPVFCEAFPGTSITFLETLYARHEEDSLPQGMRKIAFIIHGGLPERSHRSTTVEYARRLPDMLNGEYAGILNLGNALRMTFMERARSELLDEISNIGAKYMAHHGTLFFPEAEQMATGDIMTEAEGVAYCKWANRFSRHISEMQGCTVDLCHRPYAETNE